MMRITCPQCGFFRELPDSKVPVTSTMATCPKCRHRFRFRPELGGSRREARAGTGRENLASELLGDEVSSWRRPSVSAARTRQADPAAEPEAETPPRARSVFAADPVEAGPEPEIEAASAPREMPAAPPELPEEIVSPPSPPEEAPPAPPPAARRQAARTVAAPPTVPVAPEPAPPEETGEPVDSGPSRPEPEPPVPPELPAPPSAPVQAVREVPEPVEAAPEAAPESPPHARSFRPSELLDVQEALGDKPDSPPSPAPADKPAGKSRAWSFGKDGVRDIWARLQAADDSPRGKDKDKDKGKDEPAAKAGPPVTDPIPWERLDAYGFLPGLGLTLRKILLTPGEFFAAMPEGRPMGKALTFNLLISEFLLVIDFLWSLFGLRAKWAASGNADMMSAVTHSPGLGFLLALLLVPPILAVGVYLDAWFTHLLLLLFRSAKKGFNETFRVLCYSAAPTTLSAVPVAGQLLSPVILVWYMAVQAIGLTRVHQGGLTQTLAAIFIKWSVYLFLLLAVLQNIAPS